MWRATLRTQARPGFDPGRPITVLGLGHDRYTAKGIPRRLLRQNARLWGKLKSYSPSHVTADVGQGDLAGAALETVFKFTL